MVIVRIKYDLVRFCSCMGTIVLVIIEIILLCAGWSFCKALLEQRKEVDGFVSLCFFVDFDYFDMIVSNCLSLARIFQNMTAFNFVRLYDNC